MRKINPSDICTDFKAEIASLRRFWDELAGGNLSSRDRSTLAELVFHRANVAVEAFVSAWFFGAVNRDATRFFSSRRNSVLQSVASRFSVWDSHCLHYKPPKHVAVTSLEPLVDPNGWNIAFGSYEKLEGRADEWLASDFRAKIRSIPDSRVAVLDAARAIRNCTSHQSRSSFQEMKCSLAELPDSGVCSHFRRTARSVNNIGAYLKAKVGSKTRLDVFLDECEALADNLL